METHFHSEQLPAQSITKGVEMSRISKYTIKEPIWDGGTKQRAIGIAEFRLPCVVDIAALVLFVTCL